MMNLVRRIFLLVCLLGGGLLCAQNVEYGVELDTNYMLIGDQQHLTFKVRTEPGLRVLFPELRDTVVRGVEIVSGPVRDSVKEQDGKWLIRSRYVITSFDTGVYTVPSLPITIEGSEYNNVLRTDPVGFVVNTFQVDPQKGNYDIVMPYAAPWTFREILPYLLWAWLVAVVVGFGIWLWMRYKNNKPLFVAKKEEIPAHVKAIRLLDEIKSSKLWQAGHEKEYYTRLTDVVRQYLEDEFTIPAMEQTSSEILQDLEGCPKIQASERERMGELLSTADFVKFAKLTPLQDENARYLDTAYDFVNVTHQRVEAERSEEQRKEEDERKKTETAQQAQ